MAHRRQLVRVQRHRTRLPRAVVGEHADPDARHRRPWPQRRARAHLHPAAAGVEGRHVHQAERQRVRQPGAGGPQQPAGLRDVARHVRGVRHQGLPRRAQRRGRQLRPRLPDVVERLDHHREGVRGLGVGRDPLEERRHDHRCRHQERAARHPGRHRARQVGRLDRQGQLQALRRDGVAQGPRDQPELARLRRGHRDLPQARGVVVVEGSDGLLRHVVGRQPARRARLPHRPGREPGPARVLPARLRTAGVRAAVVHGRLRPRQPRARRVGPELAVPAQGGHRAAAHR